jgi:type IV pilus assembly protein PilE
MNNRGFTLIEIMIVVAIIGVLAAMAYPSLTDQLSKSRRSDAKTALLGLQQVQEKLRANCNVYALDLDTTIVNGDGDSIPFLCTPGAAADTAVNYSSNSQEGWYTIAVTSANAIGYVATATTDAGDRQASDRTCKTLILTVDDNNPNGQRTSTDSDGNPSTSCW